MPDAGLRRRRLLNRLWKATPAPLRRLAISRLHPRVNLGAIGVFFDGQGRVLFLRHVFRDGQGWALPGGYLQAGEVPEEGLARELQEETGLACEQPVLLRAVPLWPRAMYELLFRAEVPQPAPLALNFEIFEARWCDPSALPEGLQSGQSDYVQEAVLHRAQGRPPNAGGSLH